MTKSLILGISGQDGSYLAQNLLENGHEVHGVIRRNSIPEHQESRINFHSSDIHTYYGDLLDSGSLLRLLTRIQPDHVYNLAAQSHVRISFDIPEYTAKTNAFGVLNLLELLRMYFPEIKYYQASSSEMFGDSVDSDGYQRETTPMTPVSPYGCAKLFAYHTVRNYRKSYRLFATNGILFNHESPRRASNFVTSKIVKSVVQIKLGLLSELRLGNLDSYRDWGHSKDYVEAMRLMMHLQDPNDYVVATGETRSVRDLCKMAFALIDKNYEDYVVIDKEYLRPEELPFLKGDSSKFRHATGWLPKISFENMIEEMMKDWTDRLA
jgi:GDPmannose 4,6-dehydratase